MVYTVYTSTMTTPRRASTVLTIRVPRDVDRRLQEEARRQRKTRSDIARAILESSLSAARPADPRVEARRQSKLAAASASEDECLRFVTDLADLRGWK
jgi:predicted transcriptional regulator